jgi:hypothetical protein
MRAKGQKNKRLKNGLLVTVGQQATTQTLLNY